MAIFCDVLLVGGGAASFYAAAHLLERHPECRIIMIERGNKYLQKVRISGGGRCNVTNDEKDPKIFASHYPRGHKQLIGPLHRYGSIETRKWFEDHGVKLKAEADGRVFPVSNKSEDIINCLLRAVSKNNMQIICSESMEEFHFDQHEIWNIKTNNQTYRSKYLFIGAGSSERIWTLLKDKGIKCIDSVPSLFTFNCKSVLLKDLMGISFDSCLLTIPGTKLKTAGPMLITHWGLSGPAVLKLSAWGARELNHLNYSFDLEIDFLPHIPRDDMAALLTTMKISESKATLHNRPIYGLASRFWKSLLSFSEIKEDLLWADSSKLHLRKIVDNLKSCRLPIKGKSTFKEEFVTAGGVDLDEVDFKHFSLKKMPTLYLAGEILNIDGITGGFNFQAAWSGAWIAAESISQEMENKIKVSHEII